MFEENVYSEAATWGNELEGYEDGRGYLVFSVSELVLTPRPGVKELEEER
jgi:hypothetical protein